VEDTEIIELYLNGDKEAANILVEKYKNDLYNFCSNLTKNSSDADELFQNTWIKAVKNIKGFNLNKSFKNWLFTICINTYKDEYRKKKRWLSVIKDYFTNDEKDKEFNMAVDTEKILDEKIIEKEDTLNLRIFVNSLSDIFKVPIILFYFEEKSYDEISEILEIPIGTVKSRLNSGKKKLKCMIEGDINE
jgi:RNA polymerase sigma-70 factor (ECF subfamily)